MLLTADASLSQPTSSLPPLEIAYALKPTDFIAFREYLLRHHPGRLPLTMDIILWGRAIFIVLLILCAMIDPQIAVFLYVWSVPPEGKMFPIQPSAALAVGLAVYSVTMLYLLLIGFPAGRLLAAVHQVVRSFHVTTSNPDTAALLRATKRVPSELDLSLVTDSERTNARRGPARNRRRRRGLPPQDGTGSLVGGRRDR